MTKRVKVEPTYADCEDIALTLGLPDPNDPMGLFRFTDVSVPNADYVDRLIVSAEDEIDFRIQKSWRENRVVNHVTSLVRYEKDLNGVRVNYFQRGGSVVQLHRWMLPIDPTKGDRIEIRIRGDDWRDITEGYHLGDITDDPELLDNMPGMGAYHADLESGRLFVRTRLFQTPDNAIRVTYRWGSMEPVPEGINRLCCLLVAKKIILSGIYDVKVGVGGDIAGIKEQLLREWDAEAGRLFSVYQRTGSVRSLLQ